MTATLTTDVRDDVPAVPSSPGDVSALVGSVASDATPPAGLHHDPLHVDRSAGFGQLSTRVYINGPDSYRLEIAFEGEPVAVFCSVGEIAMAIYLSDLPVSHDLPTAPIAELVVAGVTRVGHDLVAVGAVCWQQCGNLARHEVCTNLAWRLSGITQHPGAYPRFPHYQPDWRHVVR